MLPRFLNRFNPRWRKLMFRSHWLVSRITNSSGNYGRKHGSFTNTFEKTSGFLFKHWNRALPILQTIRVILAGAKERNSSKLQIIKNKFIWNSSSEYELTDLLLIAIEIANDMLQMKSTRMNSRKLDKLIKTNV